MKGYLNKIEEWFVIFDQRTMQDPSAEDGMLPLHPHDVAVSSFSFHNGKEVEFEIIQYDGTIPILNAWNGYAKLIEKSDRTCDHTNCREVCPECKPLSEDCEEVKNWDSFVEQKNIELEVNKLAEEDELQFIKKQLENIEYYKLGYNVAQRKLYTKEQMELCWIAAMSNRAGFSDSISYKEFIQSLKQ